MIGSSPLCQQLFFYSFRKKHWCCSTHTLSTILLVMIPHCFFIAGMCPVLCSGHGDYEDGQCRCFPGWKGLECQLRHDQCEVADCSGHGQCVNGKCVCARGYTGNACQQSKYNHVACSYSSSLYPSFSSYTYGGKIWWAHVIGQAYSQIVYKNYIYYMSYSEKILSLY